MVLCKLGRYPLSVICKERAVKVLIKIKDDVNQTLRDQLNTFWLFV